MHGPASKQRLVQGKKRQETGRHWLTRITSRDRICRSNVQHAAPCRALQQRKQERLLRLSSEGQPTGCPLWNSGGLRSVPCCDTTCSDALRQTQTLFNQPHQGIVGCRLNGYENSISIQIKFKLSKLTLSTANVKNSLRSQCCSVHASWCIVKPSHFTTAGEKMLGEQ